ncbi:DUF4133 domain-containing protein [Maribacter litopenaei]|uniref:DUF4133 domain-containing protein n=1 Tax=Maribacter litopenaei TaxID=2976127 RepID=A0ABY5Y843_9FLAO|nr:DUF4133 domain-containing protein [Maribacter litopenaei]UWX54320.1 DUF4133 domain-containing protein [Maribacter litopenaei]
MEEIYYPIHKGLQKEVFYLGLKAKYIYYGLYLGIGIVLGGLLLSAFLPMLWSMVIIAIFLFALFLTLLAYSRTYGAYGFIKKVADRKLPAGMKQHTPFKNLPIWKNV